MLDHHIQKKIVSKLVGVDTARFSQIRPAGIDSNIFAYHLKTLIREKLVLKHTDNTYSLTSAGTFASVHLTHDPIGVLELAHSIIFVAIHFGYHSWLLQKRPKRPFQGKYGFVSFEPSAGVALGAMIDLQPGDLFSGLERRIAGSGFIHVSNDGVVESFRHFTLVEIKASDQLSFSPDTKLKWFTDKEMQLDELVPGVHDLIAILKKHQEDHFFTELRYEN